MAYDERYEIRNEEIERVLRRIAVMLDEQLPAGVGFGLFLFEYGDNGAMFWISSGDRQDVIAALKEWITKNERPAE